ncbi:MAG: cationic amino acid transporter [Monoraphidium minutum]|nr:MAG: cationic amino acid transporter [Monoraphidium minutum]
MKPSMAYKAFGFGSLGEYGRALAALPTILGRRAFAPLMPADPIKESGASMKQVLGWFDLVCLGIGMMLGAGVFVTTGYVTANKAGPGVIISYIVAGICAMLSSFCYAEFAVDIPAAGGAYTYIAAALGEFMAWLAVANLIFEYILANAAAIRGFSPYFAALTNKPETFYIHFWSAPSGAVFKLDWWAFGWCMLLSVLLIFGTKESATFNGVVTVLHVVLVVFIIIAGLVKANPANAQPFLPFGARGAFNGASIVFFSYIGFDAVACAAEETRDPGRDLPIGILGSVSCVTVLYTLMAATLALMVPREVLTGFASASFANAFTYAGMHWATYIVALGALMGIITTTLVGMYGTSRVITGVARDHLIPPFLAHVGGRAQTPWVAIAVQGVISAVLALLSPFDELADMVSISTLFAFWVEIVLLAAGGGVFLLSTAALHVFVKPMYVPARYRVPLYPWLPALSMAFNIFLLGQLGEFAYVRFGYWTAACVGCYLLYSGASSYNKSRRDASALPLGGPAPGAAAALDGLDAGKDVGLVEMK